MSAAGPSDSPKASTAAEAARSAAQSGSAGFASPSLGGDPLQDDDLEGVAPTPQLGPGVTLGSYRILEKLGEGGMGVVFKALDTSLDRTVALKVLIGRGTDDGKQAQRFVREARAAARLSHPNLLHVYSVGSDKGCHFFAMEILHGETLLQAIRRCGRIPVQDMLHILVQIVSALHYVHRTGITHRDIKSGNIMLCGRRAVLMDFGLAKAESETGLTSMGAVLGTPDYMPPEAAEGANAGPPSDIYSLGVVLYEALSGRLPFMGKSAIAIIRQHMDSPVPPLERLAPEVRPELCAIVARCMAKKPADRYPDCPALARALWNLVPEQALLDVAEGRVPGADAMPLENSGLISASLAGAGTLTSANISTLGSAAGFAGGGSLSKDSAAAVTIGDAPAPVAVEPKAGGRWWVGVLGVIAVLLLAAVVTAALVRKKPFAGQPIIHKTAQNSELEVLHEIRANDPDQSKWTVVVSRKQADGTWQKETVPYTQYIPAQTDTEIMFTSDDVPKKP